MMMMKMTIAMKYKKDMALPSSERLPHTSIAA